MGYKLFCDYGKFNTINAISRESPPANYALIDFLWLIITTYVLTLKCTVGAINSWKLTWPDMGTIGLKIPGAYGCYQG